MDSQVRLEVIQPTSRTPRTAAGQGDIQDGQVVAGAAGGCDVGLAGLCLAAALP